MTETPVDRLFAEAQRQLTICNACRYCEGYCAVFPALELCHELDAGQISYLANLCHDCQDCYTACMYAPPHEFAINPPAVLSAVRRLSYDTYLPRLPRFRALALITASLLLAVLVASWRAAGAPPGSPYRLIAYPGLLVAVGVPAAWSVALMLRGAVRYWHDTCGPLSGLADAAAWRGALAQAASMRNLRGGGAGCSYPGDEPSGARRRLHALVMYGFLACVASTVAAGISQDIAGDPPPYPVLSAPVLLGIVGGAGLIAGCAGLLLLKGRAAGSRADAELTARDYGLLTGLIVLSATGLLALGLRATAASGPVLLVHLIAVVACFAIAPYTKFPHAVYRLLALVQHNRRLGRS